MKEIKELIFEELSVEQKLGLAHIIDINGWARRENPKNVEFILDLIKNHALGGVWVQYSTPDAQEIIDLVKETADYPILIFTDAESGIKTEAAEYLVGKHNAIGCTDSEEHAYAFGKVIGIAAKKMGYNIVCNPLLDISTTGSARSLGSDKTKVARLAAAEARGMHDAGVLTVGKHYPSGINYKNIDSHMAESESLQTKEELLEYSLYAYKELMKDDLLDGLMSSHIKCSNIDPDYPSSLSKKVINIIREEGYNGLILTDALCMMGILSKFGYDASRGLAIAAGNDLALPYDSKYKESYEALVKCYNEGMITDERLDEAVKRVLAAQKKTLNPAKYTEITEEDLKLFKSINKDAVTAKFDEGLTANISRDGKHYFVLMVRNEEKVGGDGGVSVDTFSNGWLYPQEVTEQILKYFPNSTVKCIHQFPTQGHCHRTVSFSIDYDDVIFITFSEFLAYCGREHLTRRVETLIEALQLTNRISTLVHFGNPCVLENLPHIPRYILAPTSRESVAAAIDVLAGEYPANGKLTYEITLN
ncbi:MAG: hypothetical protein IJ946_01120 [Clostridia bacterium]|nr:hypothetical protein [Clostridia bacterium]